MKDFKIMNVVATGFFLEDLAPDNFPPRGRRCQSIEEKTKKISNDSHNWILDEMFRIERLEFDPSSVLVERDDEYILILTLKISR